MKKKIALYLVIITVSALVAALPRLAVSAFAEDYPEGTDTVGDGAYALTHYMVDITVGEDNSFHIIEHITAHFNEERHGIMRRIPLRNEVVRLDGTKERNRAQISDIRVGGDESSVYTEDGYRVIRIGNPDLYITGRKDYAISYTYDIGKDRSKGYDEFYFNIIGPEWDTTISNVSFAITMPKAFDPDKVGFSHGRRGTVNSSGITYTVEGNKIYGTYEGVLQAEEALTVRLELPEGYFVGARSNIIDTVINIATVLSFVLPAVFLLIVFAMWRKVGRDDPVIETVEFYPPAGFNSADVGFALRGKAESKDVISLLIYLANKGYLRIEDKTEKEQRGKRTFIRAGFQLVKVREYAGGDKREEDFLKGLFAEKDEVGQSDLQDKFYLTLNKIASSYNKRKNREILFNKNSLGKGPPLALMMFVIAIVLSVGPSLDDESGAALFGVLFTLLGLAACMAIVFNRGNETIGYDGLPKRKSLLGKVLLGLFVFAMVGGVGLIMLTQIWGGGDSLYYLSLAAGGLCFGGIGCFIPRMPKRTPYGNEMLGKIRGFRHFLATAEKPRLETLVEQDPQYFFNILPYTYVLGISDKWIKQFEGIALQSPDWYDGGTAFSAASFGTFMNTTMAAAATAMTSSPSSDGGSDSGGGSSGGGSGGGGGSSW